MALVIPNLEDSPTFDAQAVPDKVDWQAMLASSAGTGVVSGCQVSPHTGSDMNVSVAAGTVLVGGVPTAVAAVSSLAISAASASDRKDIVVVSSAGSVSVVKGTACGTAGWSRSTYGPPVSNPPPVKPAIPANSVLLAEVYVAASTTAVASGNIVDKTMVMSGTAVEVALFGDGSDGAVVLDGSTSFSSFSTLSGGVYTLTRDVYFTNLTIDSGVTLKTAGNQVFVNGTLTGVDATSVISCDGTSATSSTGPTSPYTSAGSLGVSAASGGTGNTTSGSSGGSETTNSFGGAGGPGGTGSGHTGGSGGTVGAPLAAFGTFHDTANALAGSLLHGSSITAVNGGGGGGGGGGDGTNAGGGGGTGGGAIHISARYIAGTGSIHARGGNGFTPTTGNCGGGGGGGGGWIVVISASISAGAIAGWTVDANAGAAGSGVGTGATGTNGSAGNVFLLAA